MLVVVAEQQQDWGDLTDPAVVAARAAVAGAAGARWPEVAKLLTPRWADAMAALKAGDASAIEPAIVFLEVDPYCLFSGYEKERLYGHLSHVTLSDHQADRLRAFVLRRCRERRYRHELRKLRVLARAIATPDFVRDLNDLPRSTVEPDRLAEERFLASVADAAAPRAGSASTGPASGGVVPS